MFEQNDSTGKFIPFFRPSHCCLSFSASDLDYAEQNAKYFRYLAKTHGEVTKLDCS